MKKVAVYFKKHKPEIQIWEDAHLYFGETFIGFRAWNKDNTDSAEAIFSTERVMAVIINTVKEK